MDGKARDAFEIPADVTYLNCAYMSPSLRRVTEAGLASVRRKASPWTVGADDFFAPSEKLRGTFAELIGGRADEVALIPAVSYGLSLVAQFWPMPPEGHVLVLEDQFPSNVYPWREKVRREGGRVLPVPRPANGDWTSAVLALLDERCAVVALPQVHWTDGTRVDLESVSRRCRQVGAKLVLDLTQSLGAMPFDLAAVAPDAVVCAGYKWLLGPYSTAYLWIAERHHQERPFEHNWICRARSEDFAGLVRYRDEFQPGARRFDVGERSNFALVPMALEALQQILAWGVEEIAAHASGITRAIAEGASRLGFEVVEERFRGPHLIGIGRRDGLPEDLLPALSAERIFVSRRGHSLRISPHVYNDARDVERLLSGLERNV